MFFLMKTQSKIRDLIKIWRWLAWISESARQLSGLLIIKWYGSDILRVAPQSVYIDILSLQEGMPAQTVYSGLDKSDFTGDLHHLLIGRIALEVEVIEFQPQFRFTANTDF